MILTLSKSFYLLFSAAGVLAQPRKTSPDMTENLLTGR